MRRIMQSKRMLSTEAEFFASCESRIQLLFYCLFKLFFISYQSHLLVGFTQTFTRCCRYSLKSTCYPSKKCFFCLLLRFFRLVLLRNSVIWSSDCRERLFFFYLISITITYFCSINSQGALRNEVIRWCSV